jgi:nitroreductase
MRGETMNSFIKFFGYRFRGLFYVIHDFYVYSKYAFGFRIVHSQLSLRAAITLYTHSIEKGLSNINMRPGYGKKALSNLFRYLDMYYNLKFDISDSRIHTAIMVLNSYRVENEKLGFIDHNINSKIADYEVKFHYAINNAHNSGYLELTKKDQLLRRETFYEIALSRYSVRDYDNNNIPNIENVINAIEHSLKTPSLCNRQPWKVHIIDDSDTILKVLNLQQGLNIARRNSAPLLLVLTTDLSYYANDKERNEPFVNGGMFAMSLLYSLHQEGLAACSLNASLSISNNNKIMKLLSLPKSERIYLFISVGNYLEKFKVPVSRRDDISSFYHLHKKQ